MNISAAINSMSGKTPHEIKQEFINLYSSMPPERFFEHINNLERRGELNGRDKEREEIVCRLLANGMTAEEISVILCVKTEVIRTIEKNNAAIKIPEYTKKLKERRRRREKQAK